MDVLLLQIDIDNRRSKSIRRFCELCQGCFVNISQTRQVVELVCVGASLLGHGRGRGHHLRPCRNHKSHGLRCR